MTLQDEIFDAIVARIIKEGKPDDLPKFMLSGKECIAAVQQYFNHLEADQKKKLTLKGDEWFLDIEYSSFGRKLIKKHSGLSLFKVIASSIIPFVEDLHIAETHLKDYAFLAHIKNLDELNVSFPDNEYAKVLSGLSNLVAVKKLDWKTKRVTLELLSSLAFSFDYLKAHDFVFESNPKCDKVFQSTAVELYGDKEAMGESLYKHEYYQHYLAIFPEARGFFFLFFVKVVDDLSDILKVTNVNPADYVEPLYQRLNLHQFVVQCNFLDYSGFPESKVLKMLQKDEKWEALGSPYGRTSIIDTIDPGVSIVCEFPLAENDVENRLAKKSIHRLPEDSNGNAADYYRVTIENHWGHETEFEILKTLSCEELVKAYGQITGMRHEDLGFVIPYGKNIDYNSSIANNFHDGEFIEIWYTDA